MFNFIFEVIKALGFHKDHGNLLRRAQQIDVVINFLKVLHELENADRIIFSHGYELIERQ